MSQWTHVNGSIRFDALRMQGMPFARIEDIKALMGNTWDFDDDEATCEACTVPEGSEGSLRFMFWSNPSINSISAYTVGIFGDLRDFGSKEDVKSIKEWFNKIISTDGVMVRSAILEVAVEHGETLIFTPPQKEES